MPRRGRNGAGGSSRCLAGTFSTSFRVCRRSRYSAGIAVSGGQRQQIALARALLAEPAVLILDEPTTHLDRAAKGAVTANLLCPSPGRATLLITHDLDHLDQVDEIIVLDGGKMVERGTHAELANAHGPYAAMLRDQLASVGRR